MLSVDVVIDTFFKTLIKNLKAHGIRATKCREGNLTRFSLVQSGLQKWDKVIGWIGLKDGDVLISNSDRAIYGTMGQRAFYEDTNSVLQIPLGDPDCIEKCLDKLIGMAKARLTYVIGVYSSKLSILESLFSQIK